MMRVVNFAHGEFYMLGAYVAISAASDLKSGCLVALPVAVVSVAIVRFAFERAFLLPLHNADILSVGLVTIGLSIFLQNTTLVIWGPKPGLNHTEIAIQCGIDRVNVRNVLIRLEENGPVKQTRRFQDRRQSSAVITAYGRSLLEGLEPNVLRTHEILLRSLRPHYCSLFENVTAETTEAQS
jgi:DNA-binding MarR family transcriptional regulator